MSCSLIMRLILLMTSALCSTEHVVASPAAAVLERRLSRTTPEKRKLPCGDSGCEGSETGSDGEWSGDR